MGIVCLFVDSGGERPKVFLRSSVFFADFGENDQNRKPTDIVRIRFFLMPNFADYDQLMADSDDFLTVGEPVRSTARPYSFRSTPSRTQTKLPERRTIVGREPTPNPAGVISVTTAISRMQGVLGNMFAGLWITGEVSEISRPASGHVYFTLKEGDAQIACVYFSRQSFRHPATFRLGDRIEVASAPTIYPKGGRLQLRVTDWRHAGAGELYEAYLRLKSRLTAEGLFSVDRKKEIRKFIRRVAVVTSRDAAALQDVIRTVQRRTPWIVLTLVPAYVQGDLAPGTLISALKRADRLGVDAVLLVRGGGSFEDLNGFNDEALVRTVAAMTKPVIAGIGHETDETLAGLAADYVASTPTAAAERLGDEKGQWLHKLDRCQRDLGEGLERGLSNREQSLDELSLAMRDWLRVNVESKESRCMSKAGELTLISRSHLRELERTLSSVQLSRAIRTAWRERFSKLEWVTRSLSAPSLLKNREEDVCRVEERLVLAINDRLAREEDRLQVYSRVFRSPEDALMAHAERLKRSWLALQSRVGENLQRADRHVERSFGAFSPAVGREVRRKARELSRIERFLPDPQRRLQTSEQRLDLLQRALQALDPESPLKRGYVLVTREGEPVTRGEELKAGERVCLQFADRQREATIR